MGKNKNKQIHVAKRKKGSKKLSNEKKLPKKQKTGYQESNQDNLPTDISNYELLVNSLGNSASVFNEPENDYNEKLLHDTTEDIATLAEDKDEEWDDSDVEELVEEDPYVLHFESAQNVDPKELQVQEHHFQATWDGQQYQVSLSKNSTSKTRLMDTNKKKGIQDFNVKGRLATVWKETHNEFSEWDENLFKGMNEYQDLLCTRTISSKQQLQELRELYILHSLNHIFKTRDRVLAGNAKLENAKNKNLSTEVRDQGYTRPKVLILLPFRHSALEVMQVLMNLTPKLNQDMVGNKKRFFKEFRLEEDNINEDKPDDFKFIFEGNIDDCFRLGVSFARQSMKLYADYYKSDVIIASPLGLRMDIGTPGTKEYNGDFLSSIEVVIMEQSDLFLMQNWEHVQFIFEHLNQIPKEMRNADISRIRDWYLNGWAKYYRQTILFTSIQTPEINSLWNRCCENLGGKLKISPCEFVGSVTSIVPKIKQMFHRITCHSFLEANDARFSYFTKEILPLVRNTMQTHVLIFIDSYFDFIRLRNYFRAEELSFCQCCEYTTNANISRARTSFFKGEATFMLYTDRCHFYHRYRIRGIHSIIFYGLPQYPHYYSEILNAITHEDATCTVLFSKYDKLKLERIVGTSRTQRMISSEKSTYLFC